MRFHAALGVDFKGWTHTKMERENNMKEFKSLEEDMPKWAYPVAVFSLASFFVYVFRIRKIWNMYDTMEGEKIDWKISMRPQYSTVLYCKLDDDLTGMVQAQNLDESKGRRRDERSTASMSKSTVPRINLGYWVVGEKQAKSRLFFVTSVGLVCSISFP